MRKVRAGEAIKQPSASEWNRIANAVEAIERLNKSKPKQADIDSGIALVKNTTANTLGQFSIVGLDDAIVTDPQTAASPTNEIEFKQQRHVFNAVAPSLPKHAGKWAVTLDVIEPNAIGRVRIDGVVICKAAWPSVAGASSSTIASRELRRYAEAIGGDVDKLQIGPKGSAQVLWVNDVTADSAAGEGWAIIRIGSSVELPTITRFTLTAALAEFGTAAATIASSGADDGDSITVTDWAGNAAESGDHGIAWKVGSTYYVIEIKTAVDEGGGGSALNVVRFTLTANLAAGSTAAATINSDGADDGDAITVTDWCNNAALSGNKGLAVLVGSTYYVLELFDNPEVVRFTLTANLAAARGSTAAANVEVLGAGTTTAETVTNWARKWAKSGARGHAVRVFDGSSVRFDVIDVEPRATRIRGVVSSEFGTTNTTFAVDTLIGLNGDVDGADLVAYNIHEWAGKVGDKVRVEWNQADEQWEAYQIDCEEGL